MTLRANPKIQLGSEPTPAQAVDLEKLANELKKGFESQDISKILTARQKLYEARQNVSPADRSFLLKLTTVADGGWEKYKALQLLQASSSLDEQTRGTFAGDTEQAFNARTEYRKAALQFIQTLPLEKCAGGTVLEQVETVVKGSRTLAAWENQLEKDLLLNVGKSGWIALDQAHVTPAMLSISPHLRMDGFSRTGADILELDSKGNRIEEPARLLARLKEASELLPGVYLRHKAFIGKDPELRAQAALTLQALILPSEWKAVSGDVSVRFEELRKNSTAELEKKISNFQTIAIVMKYSDKVIEKEMLGIQIAWAKEFAKSSYEFVKKERAQGKLQLSGNGEKAFRELDAMYSGADQKTESINHWIDVAAIDGMMMVVSGGVGNILRAGTKVALQRLITRAVGEEALKRTSVRAGIFLASKTVEGYAFHTVMSGMSYVGGNQNAVNNFWAEGAKSTVSLLGMHGAGALAQKGVLAVAERTLPAEVRTLVETFLKGSEREIFLTQVIQSSAKLKALQATSSLTAEILYFAFQGQAEGVIAGKPISSLLSPKEWADVLVESATQVAAIRTGRKMTGGVEQSIQSAVPDIEHPPPPSLPTVAANSDTPQLANSPEVEKITEGGREPVRLAFNLPRSPFGPSTPVFFPDEAREPRVGGGNGRTLNGLLDALKKRPSFFQTSQLFRSMAGKDTALPEVLADAAAVMLSNPDEPLLNVVPQHHMTIRTLLEAAISELSDSPDNLTFTVEEIVALRTLIPLTDNMRAMVENACSKLVGQSRDSDAHSLADAFEIDLKGPKKGRQFTPAEKFQFDLEWGSEKAMLEMARTATLPAAEIERVVQAYLMKTFGVEPLNTFSFALKVVREFGIEPEKIPNNVLAFERAIRGGNVELAKELRTALSLPAEELRRQLDSTADNLLRQRQIGDLKKLCEGFPDLMTEAPSVTLRTSVETMIQIALKSGSIAEARVPFELFKFSPERRLAAIAPAVIETLLQGDDDRLEALVAESGDPVKLAGVPEVQLQIVKTIKALGNRARDITKLGLAWADSPEMLRKIQALALNETNLLKLKPELESIYVYLVAGGRESEDLDSLAKSCGLEPKDQRRLTVAAMFSLLKDGNPHSAVRVRDDFKIKLTEKGKELLVDIFSDQAASEASIAFAMRETFPELEEDYQGLVSYHRQRAAHPTLDPEKRIESAKYLGVLIGQGDEEVLKTVKNELALRLNGAGAGRELTAAEKGALSALCAGSSSTAAQRLLWQLVALPTLPEADRKSTLKTLLIPTSGGGHLVSPENIDTLSDIATKANFDMRNLRFVLATINEVPSVETRNLTMRSIAMLESNPTAYRDYARDYPNIPEHLFLPLLELAGSGPLLKAFNELAPEINRDTRKREAFLFGLTRVLDMSKDSRKLVADYLSKQDLSGPNSVAQLTDFFVKLSFLDSYENYFRHVPEEREQRKLNSNVNVNNEPEVIPLVKRENKTTSQDVKNALQQGKTLSDTLKTLEKTQLQRVQEVLPNPDMTGDRLAKVLEYWSDAEPVFTYLRRYPELRKYLGEMFANMTSEEAWQKWRYDLSNPVVAHQIGMLTKEQLEAYKKNKVVDIGELRMSSGEGAKANEVTSEIFSGSRQDHLSKANDTSKFKLARETLAEFDRLVNTTPEHGTALSRQEVGQKLRKNLAQSSAHLDVVLAVEDLPKAAEALKTVTEKPLVKIVPSSGVEGRIDRLAGLLSTEDGKALKGRYKEAADYKKSGGQVGREYTAAELLPPEIVLQLRSKFTSLAAEGAQYAKDLGLTIGDNGKLSPQQLGQVRAQRGEIAAVSRLISLASISENEVISGRLSGAKQGEKGEEITTVLSKLKTYFAGSDFENNLNRIEKILKAQTAAESKRLIAVSTDDPRVMWLLGVYPESSCQHYADGGAAQALMGYVGDAQTKLVLMFDITQLPEAARALYRQGRMNEIPSILSAEELAKASVARAITKIVKDPSGKPAIYIEPPYSSNGLDFNSAFEIAVNSIYGEAMNVDIYHKIGTTKLDVATSRNPAGQYEDAGSGDAGNAGMGINVEDYQISAQRAIARNHSSEVKPAPTKH